MVALSRPGVYVVDNTPANGTPTGTGNAVAVFMQYHPRGPLGPTQVDSWATFVTLYGGFSQSFPPTDLSLAVWDYFNQAPGQPCIVNRVVKSGSGAPSLASLTLVDSKPSSANNTLIINALSPGLYGNSITISIVPGTLLDGSSNPETFSLLVIYAGLVVESFSGLTMDTIIANEGLATFAPNAINSTTTGSNYIVVVDQNDAQTGALRNPASTGNSPLSLTGGADGSAPASTDFSTALSALDIYSNQLLLINLPNIVDTTNLGNAISYCNGRDDAFLLVDPPSGLARAAAISFGASLPASQFYAVYYPWLNINDPVASSSGVNRLVPPGGVMAGRFIATDQQSGPAQTPAGPLFGILAGVASPALALTPSDQNALNPANINVILSVPRSGVVAMGGRTCSNNLAYRYINVVRNVSSIRVNCISLLGFAVWQNNNYTLWTMVNQVLGQYLTSLWQSGGLAGTSASQAFYIICDQTNNTAGSIQQGILTVEVGIAPQTPAEFIVLKLGITLNP